MVTRLLSAIAAGEVARRSRAWPSLPLTRVEVHAPIEARDPGGRDQFDLIWKLPDAARGS